MDYEKAWKTLETEIAYLESRYMNTEGVMADGFRLGLVEVSRRMENILLTQGLTQGGDTVAPQE